MGQNDTASADQTDRRPTWRLALGTVERDERGSKYVAEQSRKDGLPAGSPLEAIATYLRELGVHSDESEWDVMAGSGGFHNVQFMSTGNRWNATWLQVNVWPTVGSRGVCDAYCCAGSNANQHSDQPSQT